MKTFTMYRRGTLPETHTEAHKNSPDEPQFEGVVFADGRCAIHWLTSVKSVSVFDSLDDMMTIHGHPEYDSELVWNEDEVEKMKASELVGLLIDTQDELTEAQRRIAELKQKWDRAKGDSLYHNKRADYEKGRTDKAECETHEWRTAYNELAKNAIEHAKQLEATKAELDNIVWPLEGHSIPRLRVHAISLKSKDGEQWAIGDVVEAICDRLEQEASYDPASDKTLILSQEKPPRYIAGGHCVPLEKAPEGQEYICSECGIPCLKHSEIKTPKGQKYGDIDGCALCSQIDMDQCTFMDDEESRGQHQATLGPCTCGRRQEKAPEPFDIEAMKADPETMASIRQGMADRLAGRVKPWSQVAREIGCPTCKLPPEGQDEMCDCHEPPVPLIQHVTHEPNQTVASTSVRYTDDPICCTKCGQPVTCFRCIGYHDVEEFYRSNDEVERQEAEDDLKKNIERIVNMYTAPWELREELVADIIKVLRDKQGK